LECALLFGYKLVLHSFSFLNLGGYRYMVKKFIPFSCAHNEQKRKIVKYIEESTFFCVSKNLEKIISCIL